MPLTQSQENFAAEHVETCNASEDEIKFKVDVLYGSVKLSSWFKPVGGKLIGMGSKTVYDKDGKFVSYSEEPTGIELKVG